LSAPEQLESYLGGRWSRGEGVETELIDPVNGDVLATASARGLDLKAALQFGAESPKLTGDVAPAHFAKLPPELQEKALTQVEKIQA